MRRLNQSTPTVIQTELHPLDESFWIEPYRDETNPEQPNPDLGLDQWYYDNTNTYKPDRTINPLVLVAKLTATDGDTKISYNPNLITGTKWYVSEWDYATNTYVEREITAQRVPGQAISEPYYLDGFDLVVRRNVLYSHSVLVRCVGVYQDPRDVGITHIVLSEAISLSTHRDATPVYPDIDVLTPSTMSFNPLLDENSRFSLKAWADWSVIAPNVVVPYRAQAGGTEQMLPSNPDIPSVSPIMDIAYGDTLLQDQEFGLRKTANGLVDEVPANTAVVSRIKGNTVAWNQLVKNGDLNPSTEVHGITRTINGNALHYSGTSTVETNFTGCSIYDGIVSTHKYYTACKGIPSSCRINSSAISGQDSGIITGEVNFGVIIPVGVTIDNDVYFVVIDLTIMFGTGNEPTTVAQFEADYEKWFGKPLTYEEYDEGSLRSVKAETIKTTGFNQWDEEWTTGFLNTDGTISGQGGGGRILPRNFIPIIAGSSYHITIPNTAAYYCLYDKNYSCIVERNNNTDFVAPNNACYMKFMTGSEYLDTYNHDICINISDPSKNGTYEPYWSANRNLDWISKIGIKRFNLWDEVWEAGDYNSETGQKQSTSSRIRSKNFIPIKSNTDYFITFPYSGWLMVCYYDQSMNFLSVTYTYGTEPFTSPSNAHYLAFSTSGAYGEVYNHDICINESVEGMNGIYVPYGETAPYFGDGLKKVGNIHDEIKVEDGVVKAIKRIGSRAYTSGDESDSSVITDGSTTTFYALSSAIEYILDLDDIPRGVLEWYGIENDTEVRVETLPWYVSGQHTDELVVDAMFGDDINIVLRARNDMNGELMPNKVYRSVKWRIPRVDSSVISNNGSAVRSDTEEMNFGAILNIGHTTMSSGDPKALEHLRLNWKTADSTVRGNEQERAQGEIDRGWGSDITIKAADLRNGYSVSGVKTTSVYPYIYLLGPYEKVVEETSPGVFEDVYDDGELVFDRPID